MRHARSTAVLLSSLLSVGIATVAVQAPVGARAAREWGPVLEVSRHGADVWDVDLATDGQSRLAAWVRWDGRTTRVLTAVQSLTGGWTAPTSVPGSGGAREVEVAYDGRGRTHVVWTGAHAVKSSLRASSGTWSTAAVVHRTATGPRGKTPKDLRLAVNHRGRAVAAWETVDADQAAPYALRTVQAVIGRPDGSWLPARRLSAAGKEAADADVGVDRAGRATAVWSQRTEDRWTVLTSSKVLGQAWGTPRALTRRTVTSGPPHLAVLPSGVLAVGYTVRGSEARGLRVRRWTEGAGWIPATAVAGAVLRSWTDVGIDGNGIVTAVFTDGEGAMWAARVPVNGPVDRTRMATASPIYYGVEIVVNQAGDALVGWDTDLAGDHALAARYRPRSGPWRPLHKVSRPGQDLFRAVSLAMQDSGEAAALWLAGPDPDAGIVQSRTYLAP